MAGSPTAAPPRPSPPSRAPTAPAGGRRSGGAAHGEGAASVEDARSGVSGSPAGADPEVIRDLRHQLEMAVDRLRDARRMAAMLGRTATGFEPDPRVEVLGNALDATVEHLTALCADDPLV